MLFESLLALATKAQTNICHLGYLTLLGAQETTKATIASTCLYHINHLNLSAITSVICVSGFFLFLRKIDNNTIEEQYHH